MKVLNKDLINFSKGQDKNYVLVFPIDFKKQKILLGQKKRGPALGMWLGFGGKVEKNEDFKKASVRELFEESNIKINEQDLFFLFDVEFYDPFLNKEKVKVFSVFDKEFKNIKQSDEMKPQWFDILDCPFSYMWPDSVYLIPLVYQNSYLKKSKGKIKFFYGFDNKKNDLYIKKFEFIT